MRINTNIGALTAANNLSKVNDAVRSSTEKLSSGFRINKASDDAAGLGVANLFRSDIRALTQAQRNAEQATSVFQIAEGGATGIQKILERMKELAAQAASDSVETEGRKRIDSEFQGLISEITRVVNTTQFQGQALLGGGYGSIVTKTATTMDAITLKTSGTAGSVSFTTGSNIVTATNGAITQTAAFTATGVVNFSALGLTATTAGATTDAFSNVATTVAAGSGNFLIGGARGAGVDYANATNSNVLTIAGSDLKLDAATLQVGTKNVLGLAAAQAALVGVDSALDLVNAALGSIGAGQNRLYSAIDSVKSTILNYQAAESSIRDLDMAAEMGTFSKNQILSQAGVAMLAQANQAGQGVLTLIRGG